MSKRLLKALLLTLSLILATAYKAEKVVEHFQSVDVNSDGKLGRQEYVRLAQFEDRQQDIVEDEEYYMELTDALYEYYDIDRDGFLTLEEWTQFAQDIVDQSSPEYEEAKKMKLESGLEL